MSDKVINRQTDYLWHTCLIITAIITRAQSPALILEFGFFWLILNMRLAYFGPEDLATLMRKCTL